MKKIVTAPALALAAALVAPLPAQAADRASTLFMQRAARAGVAEVELSRLALERTREGDVRRFAQRMIDDHSRANSELLQLAASERVTLPTTMDAAHRNAYNRLRRLSGDSFDKAYMRQMATDHDQVVTLFRNQARNGRDADVRGWAAAKLDGLQDHRRMAHDLRREERREANRRY